MSEPGRSRRFSRLWLVVVALVGSVVAMEATLQVAALGVGRFARERTLADGGGAVVLCVGDSHTFGLPLPEEESYPSQLQVALDARHGEGTFRVVNLGIPSVNSDWVLNRLERQIVQLDPVVVVVWVGINNLWNAVELDMTEEGARPAWRRALDWSKLVRLASIAFYSGSGHQYDATSRGGWFEGEAPPSGVAKGRPQLPSPGIGLERDLVAMRDLADRYGVPIAFIAYPLAHQMPISRAIARAARRTGTPWIDTTRDLERAHRDGYGLDELIDDRAGAHPSKILYGYVVESLLPVVESLAGATGSASDPAAEAHPERGSRHRLPAGSGRGTSDASDE